MGTREYLGCQQFKVSVTDIWFMLALALRLKKLFLVTLQLVSITFCYLCSMVESFEIVAFTYAQQLSLNEIQTFTALSFTLVAELVSVVAS